MNPIVHFEMPYEDSDRMASFYEQAFGWKMQKFGPEMGNYVVAQTGPTDEKTQRPTEPGAINGGFFHRTKPEQGPSVVVSVSDIEAAMKKVEEAGGKVLGGMTGKYDDIPGVGLYCGIIDSEGNRLSLLQPK